MGSALTHTGGIVAKDEQIQIEYVDRISRETLE
jgi:hypothetical protein